MFRNPRDWNEVSHLYDEEHNQAQCGYCQEGETTMEIERGDLVRFSTGREATGEELEKYTAGRTLVNLARQHMARKGGTFSEALHAVSKICPGEVKAYLLTDGFLLPRGVGKKMAPIQFNAADGWSESGVRDFLQSQGFVGGTLTSIAGGWVYTSDPGLSAFPR